MNRPKKEDFAEVEQYKKGNVKVTVYKNLNSSSYIESLEKYCDQLEKAFDKACGELEYYDNHMFGVLPVTKEQWKEWCLENESID